jgi:hypothetical protein
MEIPLLGLKNAGEDKVFSLIASDSLHSREASESDPIFPCLPISAFRPFTVVRKLMAETA